MRRNQEECVKGENHESVFSLLESETQEERDQNTIALGELQSIANSIVKCV